MRLAWTLLLVSTSISLKNPSWCCDGLINLSKPAQQWRSSVSRREGEQRIDESAQVVSRRNILSGALLAASLSLLVSSPNPAIAFENKISNQYDDRPKRRGPQPKDLGVSTRTTVDGYDEYLGLKGCGPAPNCFSSSITVEDDLDHSIPAWVSTSADIETSFAALKEAVEAYKPGQNGVDGGGFKIQNYDAKKGYLYVQFEALKNGYIDDVEFAVVDPLADDRKNLEVQVRSSSRIGYLDYGVNAKRLNYLAQTMRSKGWDSPGVDFKTHPFYAAENQR